ncbi:unnamed protein product [Gongylonema pulchrum]|uniref:Nuclear pore protein n=1 Tax=Gongylonema pulchrum TaxID=637853 RepID=A0A3P6Q7M3_9BILA|nr:unnamed protein product [Gongylonema pulchrum]
MNLWRFFFQLYKTRVDLALNDVFRCSEALWRKKAPVDERFLEAEAGVLLSGKGFSLSAVPQIEDTGVQTETEAEVVLPSTDCQQMLNELAAETEKRTRLEAERAFLNQRIVDQTYFNAKPAIDVGGTPTFTQLSGGSSLSSTMVLSSDSLELAFANAVSDYIKHKNTKKLAADFKEASLRSRDTKIHSLWEQVLAPLRNIPASTCTSVEQFRSSVPWMKHVVDSTLEFMHKKHYANEDGVYGINNHPVWEVVYHCLRAGELESVAQIANSHLQNLPTCAAVTVALIELENTKKLSAEMRMKVKAEWSCELRSCTDVYKKAVYCALLGGDVSEVCENLENWLWLKLYPCSVDPSLSPGVFHELQRLITLDYGESYFVGSDGNFLLYFQALWLTGQYERAISVLCKHEKLLHAVHMALLLNVNQKLILTSDITHPLR